MTIDIPDTADPILDATYWRQQYEVMKNTAEQWELRSNTIRKHYESDIQMIGEALLEEAEDRGWCDDFDKFVSRLNDKLFTSLVERVKTYTITKKYMVTVSTTVTTTPDKIQDEMDAYDLDDFTHSVSDFDDWDEHDAEYELE